MPPGETVKKVPKITNEDLAYWMGRVDGRLEELTSLIKGQNDRLDKLEARIEEKADKTEPPTSPTNPATDSTGDEEETHITLRWVVEKLAVPVVTAFLFWFLFAILPQIIKGLP